MKLIPTILHLYWDGSPMSALQMETVKSFHKVNPTWEIRVYVPKQGQGKRSFTTEYTGRDYFEMLKLLTYISVIPVDMQQFGINSQLPDILKSDIFRYHILYNVGGVWSDFDVLWLKPFEDIYEKRLVGAVRVTEMEGFVCMYQTTRGHHSIGVLASTPENPFYKRLLLECSKLQRLNRTLTHQMFGAELWNRVFPNFRILSVQYPAMFATPYKTFYPYGIFDLKRLYEKDDLTVLDDDVMAVHWFNGHRITKAFLNTPERQSEQNSINRILSLIKT